MAETTETLVLIGRVPVSNATTKPGVVITPLVSFYTFTIFATVNGLLACIISLFGVLSNIANIVIYLKVGFAETTNISFFSLAVADLIICITTIIVEVGYHPITYALPVRVHPREVGTAASFILSVALGCGASVTTILSLERCLCIAFPLKIKSMITRRRVVYSILVVAVYQATFGVLMFVDTGPPYDGKWPKRITYLMWSFSVPCYFCFCISSVATMFLVRRLRQSMEFRNTATASGQPETQSKERRVVRSVVSVCTIFIVCFFPNTCMYLSALIYPKLSLVDPYLLWVNHIMYSFSYVFQATASSVNIFVYYTMSTRYRTMFRSTFFCKDD